MDARNSLRSKSRRRSSGKGLAPSPADKTLSRSPRRTRLDFSEEDSEHAAVRQPLSQIKNRLADAAARSQTPVKRRVKSPTLEQMQSVKAKTGLLFSVANGELQDQGDVVSSAPSSAMPPTPRVSRNILDRQRHLEDQHYASKSKASDRLVSGGGVSTWPLMSDMRLTSTDASVLLLLNSFLFPIVIAVFFMLHGGIAANLSELTDDIISFNSRHVIPLHGNDSEFRAALLHWHNEFVKLTDRVEQSYDIPFWQMDAVQQIIVAMYLLSLLVLVYYLFENVVSASRLTPKRIKHWITLLMIVIVWTCFLFKLLMGAIGLENAVKVTVLELCQELPLQIASDHNVAPFTALVQYWRLRALPPTGPGILSLWGSLRIPDIVLYLQFYSWPFVAAIVTPVFKLIMSLKTVYSAGMTV